MTLTTEEKLALLNEAETAKVLKLIDKLAAKHMKQPINRPSRPAQIKTETPAPAPEPIVKTRPSLRDLVRPARASASRSTSVGDDEDDQPAQTVRRRGGASGGNIRQGAGTKLSRVMPYDTSPKKNKFLEQMNDPSLALKADAQVDKLIKRQVSPRQQRVKNEDWVLCSGGCGNEHFVDLDLITSREGFVCEDCIPRNKR